MVSEKAIQRKKKEIEKLADIFEKNGVYLFDYRGLAVKEMEDLRKQINSVDDGELRVIKNRLAIKYFEQADRDADRTIFRGPIAVAYADEKFVEVAKVLVDFQKDNKKIQIKHGFIENRLIDEATIQEVAKLPGRDQLMSQLAFSMAAPLKKFGLALSAPMRNLLVLMNNLKEKKAQEENNG